MSVGNISIIGIILHQVPLHLSDKREALQEIAYVLQSKAMDAFVKLLEQKL